MYLSLKNRGEQPHRIECRVPVAERLGLHCFEAIAGALASNRARAQTAATRL
jgi:hypothetical protein